MLNDLTDINTALAQAQKDFDHADNELNLAKNARRSARAIANRLENLHLQGSVAARGKADTADLNFEIAKKLKRQADQKLHTVKSAESRFLATEERAKNTMKMMEKYVGTIDNGGGQFLGVRHSEEDRAVVFNMGSGMAMGDAEYDVYATDVAEIDEFIAILTALADKIR